MSKDPAFLFYPSDFMGKIIDLDNAEIGIFIKLLCAQFLEGHLSEESMLKIMGEEQNKRIFDKFSIDDEGKYYNEWLEDLMKKRKAYTESRRKNRLSKNKNTDDTA